MANVSDITTPSLSGLLHIDALIDKGPDWNFLTSGTPNTLYYTFSVSSGIQSGYPGQEAFTLAQQSAARYAFNYLQDITKINFVETSVGTSAQLHFANFDIKESNTTGLCSWEASYLPGAGGSLASYSANAYIYLDNNEWGDLNRNLSPGSFGFQTLLHELGHALGLSHPFHDDPKEEHHDHLLPAQDNTANTIMSYTDVGGPYSTFNPYDIAALNWIYGGDGLGGPLGLNGTTNGRYFTGTAGTERIQGTNGDDVFVGMGGNDVIVGGLGTDTVRFGGARSDYAFSFNAAGELVATGGGAILTMSGIEQLSFRDSSVRANDAVNDTTPPAAPQIGVAKNAAGYAFQNPIVSGTAEANSVIKVYAGEQLVGQGTTDANGIWQVVTTTAFADGLNHTVRATATDASGNVSAFSQLASFHVDATPPPHPTMTGNLTTGGNQPVFSGTAEAGNLLQLVRTSDSQEIGRTTVKADGTWQLTTAALPNGTYVVNAASSDIAGNGTSTENSLQFTINSALNIVGTDGADRIAPSIATNPTNAGNNAIDGGKGLDTVVYTGSSDQYLVQRGVYGVTVTDRTGATGADNLINVERVQFADTMVALDVEGSAGQIYRLYQAAYDREPDPTGLRFWINAMDTGNYSLADISRYFLADKEAQALYSGADPSDEFFVTKMYQHVLHRAPDPSGFKFYVDGFKLLTPEGLPMVTRADVLAFFSESPENKAQVIGVIEHGIDFPLPA